MWQDKPRRSSKHTWGTRMPSLGQTGGCASTGTGIRDQGAELISAPKRGEAGAGTVRFGEAALPRALVLCAGWGT